jgi:hypothetical protein
MNDDRLIGRPFLPDKLYNKSVLLLSSSENRYLTPLSRMVIRRHQSGQKKIPHPRNEWDEEEMLFAKTCGKTTPGPSMGWNKRHVCRAINSLVCAQCLPVIRIPSLFHRVEQSETDFKLLEVYTVIYQKSREN